MLDYHALQIVINKDADMSGWKRNLVSAFIAQVEQSQVFKH